MSCIKEGNGHYPLVQDVNDDHCIRYPKLYLPGIHNTLFNIKVFSWSVIEGILSSLILFFIPYGAFKYAVDKEGQDKADLQSFGTVVAAILVVAVNLRCALDMSYWTGFNHFVVWGSIIYYFCFQLAFYSEAIVYEYVGVGFEAFGNPATWLTMLLTCGALIVPIAAWRFYQTSFHPTLSDRVRLRQRMRKSKSKARDLSTHQQTFRRSQRSIRSGYAFSHQRGFGDLILSGRNMRERAKEIVTTPVRLTRMLVHSVGGLKKSPTQEANPLPGASAGVGEGPENSHNQFLSIPSSRASAPDSRQIPQPPKDPLPPILKPKAPLAPGEGGEVRFVLRM